jgi:hypothetical protein
VNVLRIDVSDTIIPARLETGNDWRQLGIMLKSWEWKSADAGALRKAS